jgi:hypothetical protein
MRREIGACVTAFIAQSGTDFKIAGERILIRLERLLDQGDAERASQAASAW